MHRISSDKEYYADGKITVDADGIPITISGKADHAAVDAALETKADKTAVDDALLGIGNPTESANELRATAKTYYWSSDANATGKNLPVDRAGALTNHRMSLSDWFTAQTYLPFRDPNLYVRYFYQNEPYTDNNTDADGWLRFPSSGAVESLIADAISNLDTGGSEDAIPPRSSLTSITCFGDSLTEGYSNNVKWGDEESYPAALGRELGAGVTVTERGMSGASSATINLRAGAAPVTFRVPAGTIPGARWSAIPLETSQEHNEWASGAVNRYGYIGGGYGLLKLVDGAWTFTREEAVDDMTADFVTFLGEYKDAAGDTIIYGAGRNDITKNLSNIYPSPVESVKASVIEMLAFSNAQTKQVAFLGTITRTDETPESEGYKQVYEVNDWIRDRYPDRHIDLQGYLTGSQVWVDTGIIPTQADLDAQAQGMAPPSLFDDVTHYSKATAEAIGSSLVADWLRVRGWVV